VAYSLSQVLDFMSDISGYDIAVKVNPAFVRANEVERLVGSNAKLKRTIGELLHEIRLPETPRWMYDVFQGNGEFSPVCLKKFNCENR
jgi:hypothetical protein